MYSWELPSLRHSTEERLRKKRTVVPSCTDDEELGKLLKLYKSNKIRTTKYSLLSFLPKNLFEQLHRFANVYFILLAALNFVPVVEAFQPEIALAAGPNSCPVSRRPQSHSGRYSPARSGTSRFASPSGLIPVGE